MRLSYDLKSILYSPLMRMSEVKRFSGTRLQEAESLSQHTSEVMMMSYLLAKRINHEYPDVIDIGVLLEKCLLHDIDEVVTGDIPRNTKYANDSIKSELDEVAKGAVRGLEEDQELTNLFSIWYTAKNGPEGVLIKIVDILCVARKACIEVEVYNNLSCLKVIHELTEHLRNLEEYVKLSNSVFNSEISEYLVKLVVETRNYVTSIDINSTGIRENYNLAKSILYSEESR